MRDDGKDVQEGRQEQEQFFYGVAGKDGIRPCVSIEEARGVAASMCRNVGHKVRIYKMVLEEVVEVRVKFVIERVCT